MRVIPMLLVAALAGACSDSPDNQVEERSRKYADFTEQLRDTFHNKPAGTSRAYAIMKDGLAGPDWLATIHGYADNERTCEMLIRPYNEDASQSVLPGQYYCQEL